MAKKISAQKKIPADKKLISTTKEIGELFPVVGIGASSGGLQAVSELLENLPGDLGMA